MEMIIRNRALEHSMNQKSSAIVSERYKEFSKAAADSKDMKTQEGTGKQQETAYNRVSPDGDTVSISEAGKRAISVEKDTEPADENTADGIVIHKEAEKSNPKEEEQVSTVNLSEYTESELKQMYLDGDITKSEYDEELNSREM